MPLCSLEQFLAEQLSGSTFKVLLDVMFLYSRNALKVAFLDGGSWFFFTSHKSASLGKKPKINKDYSIYRFLFPAIANWHRTSFYLFWFEILNSMNQTTDMYVQKVTESKQTAAKYHNCNRLPIWVYQGLGHLKKNNR